MKVPPEKSTVQNPKNNQVAYQIHPNTAPKPQTAKITSKLNSGDPKNLLGKGFRIPKTDSGVKKKIELAWSVSQSTKLTA